MGITNKSKHFFNFCIVFVLLVIPSIASAVCDYQADAPDCPCFNDSGTVWDAGGPSPTLPIQSVALDTVGVTESCHTIDPPTDDDCGKPYYQLILGMNTVSGALTASYVLSEAATPTYTHRQEWCSETVSYWHREAGIPYRLGYRNEWHEDWRNYSVPQMRAWYDQEEDDDGLGRWIASGDVDYDSAELGVTLPTPGAYMAISCLHPYPRASWCDPSDIDKNHSLMIDEIWIHKDAYGDVFKVEATFFEGNSGRTVINTRHIEDLLSLTTKGSQWLSYNDGPDNTVGTDDDYGVKIYGFGIALDDSGDPIYDDTRVHYVDHPYLLRAMARARIVTDEPWNRYYVSIEDRLTDYVKALRKNGGPQISCTATEVKTERTPNGAGEKWIFPLSLATREVVVDFDFLNKNPLVVRGLMMFWDASFIPSGYKVFFGPDKEHFTEAVVADLSELKPFQGSTPIPVNVKFPFNQKDIRYIRIIFPKSTFYDTAVLTEMIVNYSHGPSEDTSDVPEEVSLFVDVRPGTCPNIIRLDENDNLQIAILGSKSVAAGGIDEQTIRLNGKDIKFQSVVYKDVTMPFIGTDPGCHEKEGDKIADLIITYQTSDVIKALGLDSRKGVYTPIIVTGKLNDNYGNQRFVGQDFVKVPGPPITGPVNLLLEPEKKK